MYVHGEGEYSESEQKSEMALQSHVCPHHRLCRELCLVQLLIASESAQSPPAKHAMTMAVRNLGRLQLSHPKRQREHESPDDEVLSSDEDN